METKTKNVKISNKHHEILKKYCDEKGLKMYRVIEKWIDVIDTERGKGKKDIYGEY